MEPEEIEWVRKARQRDRCAFERLVDTYWHRLRQWLVGMCCDVQAAEDLAQEALLKAWVKIESLQSEAAFRVWLFRLARNAFLNNRRSAKRLPNQPLPEQLIDRRPDPLQAVQGQELERRFESALAELPWDYRGAYLLWVREEMPYDEIARILGIHPKTARWRVCKARKLLLARLHDLIETES